MLIGTPLLALLAWPGFVAQDWRAVGPGVWLGTAYSTVVAVALGYVVWNWVVQQLGGARASLYANVVPVIGLAMGILLLHERRTLLGTIGAAATLGGIYLSRSSSIVRLEN
ncbi:MAG: DMT family transporter [Chloroflexi bacterium]|nr:DMT family transporter [Chloroflexota bacterium]